MTGLRYFVLVYDRKAGKLIEPIVDFAEEDLAAARQLAFERRRRSDR